MENFVRFNRFDLIEERILAFYISKDDGQFMDDNYCQEFFQSSGCFNFRKIRQFLWPEVSDDNVDTIFNGG